MRSMRDFFNADLENVFFNQNEFAEEIMINNQPVTVILDPDLLRKQQLNNGGEGLNNVELLFQVRKAELPKKPKTGERIKVGNINYAVSDVTSDSDMYTVSLVRYQGR
ncbi:hypothetical protein SFC55_03225 [Niallia taxi]|uniref:head-tail joining protein n=1 Tax=Niallia taxi TaxID=2499688 RepID=UPI003982286A